jgi:uncharacterized protein involved in exopolysaccharide biosynthesis
MSGTTLTPEAHPPLPQALDNGFGDTLIPLEHAASTTGALRRHWFVVVACVVLAVCAAVAITLTSPKMYDSTAKLLLDNSEPIDVVQQSTNSRSLDPERDLNTWVALVKTNDVAQPVRHQLGLSMSASQLLGEVSASAEGNSNVIAVRVRDRSPARAATIANAFANQYVTFRRDSARSLYGEAARSAEARLATLPARARTQPLGRELSQRANALSVASNLQTGGVRVVDQASASAHPATPRTRFTIAIAALLGLMLGAVLAVARDRPRLS